MTPTERLLLTCLVRNAGRIVNHRELLETMSPGNPNESIAHLRACISRLRNKIEIDPALPRVIITHHRQGYSFLGKEEAGGFENLNHHDRYCLRIEMEMYHFVTNWFFQAPIQRVWEELIDVESWPTWWQSWKKATIRGTGPRVQLGSVVDCGVKGALPYTLCFSVEITALQPPRLTGVEPSGDLVGSGKGVLEPRAGGTACTYCWDVSTTSPILNLLGKLRFARAVMEKNHDDVMASAYRVLRSRLEG